MFFLYIFSVCLQDSVLAFHKHGMQGRSFKANEVTQEICDKSRLFRLLGWDRYVILINAAKYITSFISNTPLIIHSTLISSGYLPN